MVHVAFDVVALVKSCPAAIESIALWDTTLLAGCNDGALRMFVPSGSGEPYKLKETKIGFARKAITQLDASLSKKLLFSLADGIGVRCLPELDPLAPTLSNKTRGANVFSWNNTRGILCVALRKKLLFFKYDGRKDFVEVREVSLPDTVKSMVWSGDFVFIGLPTRRDYCAVSSITGLLTEVSSTGRTAAPLLSVLPSGEVLLTKDNICVFVDSGGKSSRPGDALSWSEAPLGLVVHPPLVLGKLVRYIEVRSLWPGHALVQTIPLPALSILSSSDSGIVAVSGREVWQIQPVPIEKQVMQLVNAHRLLDALAYCALLPPAPASLRSSLEDSIHMRYGLELFQEEEFEEAMAHLALSSVHLPLLLSLFPTIRLPAAASLVEKESRPYESEEADLWDDHRDSLSGSEAVRAQGALVSYLSHKRVSAPLAPPYASTVDTALLQALLAMDSAPSAAKVSAYRAASESAVKLGGGPLQQAEGDVVLHLLSAPNACDVSVCQPVLMAARRFRELVALCRTRGMHREALRVLREGEMSLTDTVEYLKGLGGEEGEVVLEGCAWVVEQDGEMGLHLLQALQPPLPVESVLQTLKAPSLRTSYLEHLLATAAPQSSGQDDAAPPPGLHDELVHLHLDSVLSEYRGMEAEGRWSEDWSSQGRQKLSSALQRSTAYSPAALMPRLPRTALYAERALILGRLQRHLPLLLILARKLGAYSKCLAYCDEKVGKDSSLYLKLLQVYLDPHDAIHHFHDVSGSTEEEQQEWGFTTEVLLEPALLLLSQRPTRISWKEANKLVPDEASLQGLMGFLDPAFRQASEGRRYLAVVKSLRRAENLAARSELVVGRRRRVKMSGERPCGICGKRIGSSVFAVTPQDVAVHFVCQQQRGP